MRLYLILLSVVLVGPTGRLAAQAESTKASETKTPPSGKVTKIALLTRESSDTTKTLLGPGRAKQG